MADLNIEELGYDDPIQDLRIYLVKNVPIPVMYSCI
jgi:hypothetical protein